MRRHGGRRGNELCAHILGRMITQIAAKFGDLVSAAPAAAGELQKDEMEMSVSLQPGSDFPRSFF